MSYVTSSQIRSTSPKKNDPLDQRLIDGFRYVVFFGSAELTFRALRQTGILTRIFGPSANLELVGRKWCRKLVPNRGPFKQWCCQNSTVGEGAKPNLPYIHYCIGRWTLTESCLVLPRRACREGWAELWLKWDGTRVTDVLVRVSVRHRIIVVVSEQNKPTNNKIEMSRLNLRAVEKLYHFTFFNRKFGDLRPIMIRAAAGVPSVWDSWKLPSNSIQKLHVHEIIIVPTIWKMWMNFVFRCFSFFFFFWSEHLKNFKRH